MKKPKTLNERRRTRYEEDERYREDLKLRARKDYRKEVSKELTNCLPSSPPWRLAS